MFAFSGTKTPGSKLPSLAPASSLGAWEMSPDGGERVGQQLIPALRREEGPPGGREEGRPSAREEAQMLMLLEKILGRRAEPSRGNSKAQDYMWWAQLTPNPSWTPGLHTRPH